MLKSGCQSRGNVVIFGASPDVTNLGVRALASSLIRLIALTRPATAITLMYGSPSPGARVVSLSERDVRVQLVNFRLSPHARLPEHLVWIFLLALVHRWVPLRGVRAWITRSNRWLRTLAEADLVSDINGGDSFSDIYGLRRFLVGVTPVLTAILMGQAPVLLPQTYGPYGSPLSRALARFIMARAGAIYARDHESLDVARKLLGQRAAGRVLEFCPDVAFMLDPRAPAAEAIMPPLPVHDGECLVGLNVSGLLWAGGYSGDNMFGLRCDYKALMRALLERLLDEPGVRVLLVPHLFGEGPESDQPACRELREELPAEQRLRVHLVGRECDERQIKGLIGRCDFFIGSRMHACIAAMSQGIACIGLAYSRKFAGVFGSIDAGDMILDARQLGLEPLLEQCLERLRQRERIAARLSVRIPLIKAQVAACFETMLGGLKADAACPILPTKGYGDVVTKH